LLLFLSYNFKQNTKDKRVRWGRGEVDRQLEIYGTVQPTGSLCDTTGAGKERGGEKDGFDSIPEPRAASGVAQTALRAPPWTVAFGARCLTAGESRSRVPIACAS